MRDLLKRYGWHEWLSHTNFSFLLGASHPHEYIERASNLDYESLAITDYDGVYGIARAYGERKKLANAKEIAQLPLHYGAELHLDADHHQSVVLQNTLTLIAQSHRGYYNLCKIISFMHRERKSNAFIPLPKLLEFPVEDLVAIQAMRGLIRRDTVSSRSLEARFAKLNDHFCGRVYLAISRHLSPAEDHWIQATWTLAKRMGLRILLSQDPFFHTRSRKNISDILSAIRHNKTVDSVSEQLFVNSERCLHPKPYLEQIYGSLPFCRQALVNANELAESINFDLDELRYQYPQEFVPSGYSSQSFLEKIVWEKAETLYAGDIPASCSKLLTKELDLIKLLNFADYFLTVWDIVCWARSQNILCQGRGSAANSAVCFVLGITALDPQHFNLLFERFISLERGDPPDIDVDFENARREEVIQYIYTRYGRDRAAMVCNVICFRSKGALRSVGKALGVAEPLLNKASKLLRRRHLRHSDINLLVDNIAQGQVISSHTLRLWAEVAKELRGFPRHLGIHSGGFMLTHRSINWLLPVEPASMPGRSVITWCKDDIEGLGFFKIDILALGMLTAIKKTLQLINQHYKKSLVLASIPAQDQRTYAMIQAAETVGTFQIESRAQMAFLPKHLPQSFYDLVVQVAIIRPGPIEGGMVQSYLKRRRGQQDWTMPHPKLEKILRRSYGVPIFQEQIMRIAIAVGGFSAGEADELRKKIGAFSISSNEANCWIERLKQGMRDNGISEAFITTISGHMRGFASYGFPESHAASFALIAYASAYLKCHYPDAFFAALLNSQPMGFYAPDTLIKTARHGGKHSKAIEVLPVCLWHSEWDSGLSPCSDSKRYAPFAIRLGLRMVNGLNRKNAQTFVSRRKLYGKQQAGRAPLATLLSWRALDNKDLSSLAAANALHLWGYQRRDAIWLAASAPYAPFFEGQDGAIAFRAETEWEAIQSDYNATNTSLGRHPSAIIREDVWPYPIPSCQITLGSELMKHRHGTTISAFGMILVRQAPPSAKGFMFITIEDASDQRPSLVIRPHIYRHFGDTIESQSFLCVTGYLEKDDAATNIMVTKIHRPTLNA